MRSIRPLQTLILCIILVCVASAIFFDHISMRVNPFFGDENLNLMWTKQWLVYLKDLGFFDKPRFHDLNSKHTSDCHLFFHPPLEKYLIAGTVLITGQLSELASMKVPYDYSLSPRENIRRGALPSPRLMMSVRSTMAIIGVLTCLLLFCVGCLVCDSWTGFLAGLLFVFSKNVPREIVKITGEAPLVFFLTLQIIILIYFVRCVGQNQIKRSFYLSALGGVVNAFAASSKLNGALSFVVWFFVSLGIVIQVATYKKNCISVGKTDKYPQMKQIIVCFLTMMSAGLLTFILLNPMLWLDSFCRAVYMVNHYLVSLQPDQVLHGLGYFYSYPEKMLAVYKRVLSLKSLGLKYPGAWFFMDPYFILFNFGVLTMVRDLFGRSSAPAYLSSRYPVLIWMVVTFVMILWWIPYNWPRYFLPLYPCVCIAVAYGIVRLCKIYYEMIRSAVNKRRQM